MSHPKFFSGLTKPTQKNIKLFLDEEVYAISNEEAISRELTMVDVRTQEEFNNGRIPNALNYPIFDNLERSEIGKIYKNLGKENAINKGLDFFQPKLNKFLLSLSSMKSEHLVVYCARGGMRSKAIASLLYKNGFSVSQMKGGYKGFRRFVLQQLKKPIPPLIVLHGKTGVGKTLLLKKLPNHLDLEGLAQHRSSLFGAIYKTPNNQKNFEAFLVQRLKELDSKSPVFIEGESRKVGNVFIPEELANAMKKGILLLMNASIETRVSRIVKEYQIRDAETFLKIEKILVSLKQSMGISKTEKMRCWLKNGDIENIVHMLLVDYYDPRYYYSMKKYKFVIKISTEDLDQAANDLIDFRKKLILNK